MALSVCAGVSASLLQTEGRQDQAALARMLISDELTERRLALLSVDRLAVPDVDAAVRSALFDALRREAALHVARYRAVRQRRAAAELEDPTFVGALTRSVVRLEDPRAIPALAEALGFGFAAIHALAAFGESAAGDVLSVVEDPETRYNAVQGGITTLRFMIEAPRAGVLSERSMQRVREVVRNRLTGVEEFLVLWAAIDLAGVLRDADLLAIVKAIGDDPAELVKRELTHPEVVSRTKQRASDALAGIPPKPRPPGDSGAAQARLEFRRWRSRLAWGR